MSLQAPGALAFRLHFHQGQLRTPALKNRGHFPLVTLALWKTKKQAGVELCQVQVVLKEYKEL